MTKMSKKDMSNEQLARVIAKGFEGVDDRFDEVDNRFDGISTELTGIKQDLENLELRMGHLAYAFDVKDLKKRMAVVERKVGIK